MATLDIEKLRKVHRLMEHGATEGERTAARSRANAEKRADVLAILAAHPELSDREIARRAGVSPQTVNTHRRATAAASKCENPDRTASSGGDDK